MKWADVNLARALVTLRGTDAKSGQDQARNIPLKSEALDVLQAWKPDASGDCVFPGQDGEPLQE